jgi:hypothetical protein
MNNDKKLNPEDAAKKLQGMVSLGIPDTKFSVQPASTAQLPESIKEVEKESDKPEQTPAPVRRKKKGPIGKFQGNLFPTSGFFRQATSVHYSSYP